MACVHHLRKLFAKLGVRKRAEAVRRGQGDGAGFGRRLSGARLRDVRGPTSTSRREALRVRGVPRSIGRDGNGAPAEALAAAAGHGPDRGKRTGRAVISAQRLHSLSSVASAASRVSPVVDDREKAAHLHHRTALRRERGDGEVPRLLDGIPWRPIQQGRAARRCSHSSCPCNPVPRERSPCSMAVAILANSRDAPVAVQLADKREGRPRAASCRSPISIPSRTAFRRGRPVPVECGLRGLVVLQYGQQPARLQERPAFGPKRGDGEFAAFLDAGPWRRGAALGAPAQLI